jgi:hypothetical protein
MIEDLCLDSVQNETDKEGSSLFGVGSNISCAGIILT